MPLRLQLWSEKLCLIKRLSDISEKSVTMWYIAIYHLCVKSVCYVISGNAYLHTRFTRHGAKISFQYPKPHLPYLHEANFIWTVSTKYLESLPHLENKTLVYSLWQNVFSFVSRPNRIYMYAFNLLTAVNKCTGNNSCSRFCHASDI